MCKYLLFLFVALKGICAEDTDVSKVSEAMGHLIGKNLQSLGLNVDIDAILKGIQDASLGKISPLSEDECVQAIAALQEESLSQISEKNLNEANSFLEKNREEEGIVSLEEGKLQYRVKKKGEGSTVESYHSPILHYKASYLNGTVFGTSEENELLSLDEAIPGFSKGIIGMSEGEVRILYVHPDLGFGKQNGFNPNSLLIFEVEIVKADASADAHAASHSEVLPQTWTPPEEVP